MKKLLTILFILYGFVASAQIVNQPGYTTINSRYQDLGRLFNELGLPAGGTATFKPGQAQRAGSVYYDSTGANAGYYIYDGTAWVLQGSPSAVALQDEHISGGQVTYSGTGLKFYISPSIDRIGGVIYGTTYDSVTLSASDPDDPRKDVIYVATTGIEVLEGTPAGPAAEPQLDAGQIKLTVVDIPALATTPGLTQNIIWDVNTESVVTNVGTTTDPDNLTNVYHLTKSINVTNINAGDEVILTLPSTVNLNAYDGISLFLKLKAILPSGVSITIAGFNGALQVTPEIGLGFNRNFLPYQGISLAMTRLTSGASNTFIDKIRFRFAGTATVQAGFYLDYIYLESGVLQPGGSGTPVTIGPIDSQLPSPNGLTANNNVITAQTASQTNPGLLSPADKTKLDSLHSDYFIENAEATYNQLATQINDSTVGIKTIKDSTGIGIVDNGTYLSIYSTGAGSQNLQDVTDIGNTTTDTVNAGAFGVTNGHIFNESGDFTIRGRTGSILFLGADDSNKWFITPSGRLGETGAGDLGAYTFQSTLGTSRFKDLVMEYEAAPGTPSAGLGILYTKSADKKIYWKDDDGVEYDLTGGGGSYTDADARAAISLTTTGTSGVATYNSGTGVLNVPDYSSGASIWNGVVIGTSFSATSTTISTAAVQWTFTGSSPATFTLPARTSSVNQFYTIKNIGSADLTVAAAGTDDIFTTASVASITVVPGGSVMITGAANGTSDLWTALFHTTGTANLIVDSIGVTGTDVIVVRNDSLLHRLITGGANITVDTLSTGEVRISATGGGPKFSMNFLCGVTATFTDAATLYFGNVTFTANSTWSANYITIDRDCTLASINIESLVGTAGTNEAWSLYVRVNDATDYLIESTSVTGTRRRWDNNAINIPLVAGDQISIKSTNPTWATNPANGYFSGYAVFE